MKKIVLALMLTAACMGTRAQYDDNTLFWSFNAGGVAYQHSTKTTVSAPSVGLSIGRWLARPLAFRLSADFALAPSYYHVKNDKSGNSPYFMGSAEFVWDVNASFFNVENKRFLYPCPVYPIIGVGYAFRPSVTIDNKTEKAQHGAFSVLGLNCPVRLSSSLDLNLEYKCHFFLHKFDHNNAKSYMHNLGIGLTYHFYDDPICSTPLEKRRTGDDWFVGLGAGVSFSSFEFEYLTDSRARYWNFTPEIMVGRDYTDLWTIRLELSGFYARHRAVKDTVTGDLQAGESYTYNYLHTDFMLNLSHIGGATGNNWDFMPYAGGGLMWTYGDSPRFGVAFDGGLFVRRHLNETSDLYLDLKYVMAPARITVEKGDSGNSFGVGFPMLTIGYLYNFGK